MTEMNSEKIEKLVLEILNSYFKIWKFSPKTLQIMIDGSSKYIKNHSKEITDIPDIKKAIKNYIKNSILYTCSHNSNSKLLETFFTPYQSVYLEMNQFLDLEDSSLNRNLFIQSVLDTLLEGVPSNSKYVMNRTISVNYQLNRKNYETQHGIQRKKTKNQKKYYESKFYGDPKLFQEMLSYLNPKEQEDILTATFMSEGFISAFRKINNGIKVYFLLTYLKYEKEKKVAIIKEAMDSQKTNTILKKLQAEYANKFNISIGELTDELNKRNRNIDCRYLSVFLGLDIYNLEDDINSNDVSMIIQKATSMTKKLVSENLRKGLYHYFLYDPIDVINYAVQELKEKRPAYYDIVIKKHGDTLEEVYPLTTKENDIYTYSVKMMRKMIIRIEKDRKEMLKKSLKETESMLYLIKERRRNTNIQELSQKYSISKEKIGTLFANHLLLFGSLIPEVIQELKDLNIPIENSEHYQFYQEYTLPKNARQL